MRFNSNLNIDFTKWTQVKIMERENNKVEKHVGEELPKSVLTFIVTRINMISCTLLKGGSLSVVHFENN